MTSTAARLVTYYGLVYVVTRGPAETGKAPHLYLRKSLLIGAVWAAGSGAESLLLN